HCLIVELLERLGPGLAGALAAAARVELLAIGERGRQVGVGAAAGRDRLRHVLALAAMAVERRLGRRAEPLAGLLVIAEPARCGRIGDREIVAVARAHA